MSTQIIPVLTVTPVPAPPMPADDPSTRVVREAAAEDAPAIHALVEANLHTGHLLPRTLADVTARAPRFTVVADGSGILACGELAPLNATVAEIRSLVVREGTRGMGLGHIIVDELRRRARAARYRSLCAFTHDPRFFVRMGFSIVPHTWMPEKVAADCWSCQHFQKCGQYAVVDSRLGRSDRAMTPEYPLVSDHVTIEPVDGGVAAPAGFRVAGVSCGIKKTGALDLALIVADRPAAAAGVFTQNKAQAAPVLVSREHLTRSGGRAAAIVVNSGCANACTGPEGMAVTRSTADFAASVLGCAPEQVLVASTGVIGVQLDLDKVRKGTGSAATVLSRQAHLDAAKAIMTTDIAPKEAAVRVLTPAGAFHVGGMAKGAGMIEPNMATMLGFITTDAAVAPAVLQRALKDAVDVTFNAITIDGDTSTNDTVFLLASGASGVGIGGIGDAAYGALVAGLREVCGALARAIVRGGEGASKLVSITITGAASEADAVKAAKTVANSLLVKTAIHGGDPNWGRLVAAAGRAGVAFDVERASVLVGSIVLFQDGVPFDDRAPLAADYLTGTDIDITIDLGAGGSRRATVWTCDLSAEYVKINAEYRT